jgi:hypothetical protein
MGPGMDAQLKGVPGTKLRGRFSDTPKICAKLPFKIEQNFIGKGQNLTSIFKARAGKTT